MRATCATGWKKSGKKEIGGGRNLAHAPPIGQCCAFTFVSYCSYDPVCCTALKLQPTDAELENYYYYIRNSN